MDIETGRRDREGGRERGRQREREAERESGREREGAGESERVGEQLLKQIIFACGGKASRSFIAIENKFN